VALLTAKALDFGHGDACTPIWERFTHFVELEGLMMAITIFMTGS
jgi:hypothetical protein